MSHGRGFAITVTNSDQLGHLLQHIKDRPLGYTVYFEPKTGSRSTSQNAAMHVYFRLLADTLNAAGLDMNAVLREGTEIPWTEHSVKTHLWKSVQDAMFGKDSTTELNKLQVGEIYETLSRHLGAKFGVSVAFPEAA